MAKSDEYISYDVTSQFFLLLIFPLILYVIILREFRIHNAGNIGCIFTTVFSKSVL